ncbi:MAG: SOS response-associated peptidase [Balneolales bacterium]
MTGRYTLFSNKKTVEDHFQSRSTGDVQFEANYNVAPGNFMPVIFMEKARENRIANMKWGLQTSESGGKAQVNAKAETLTQQSTLIKAFERKRCIIPANGFYEWKTLTSDIKLPFYIRLLDDELFGFAGIFDRYTSGNADILTFAIITTRSNELLQPLHDRMPVILHPENYDYWLNPINSDQEKLGKLLKPFPTDQMSTYRVNNQVNDLKNNNEDLIKPVM